MAVLLFETTPDGGFGSHKEAQAWKPKPMMLRPFGSSEATIPNPVPDPPPAVSLVEWCSLIGGRMIQTAKMSTSTPSELVLRVPYLSFSPFPPHRDPL
ncbi:hypothetical protein VTN96DRAFT_1983 [Rasamsonia emersonii]